MSEVRSVRFSPFRCMGGNVSLAESISWLKNRERDARVVMSTTSRTSNEGLGARVRKTLAVGLVLCASAALLSIEIGSGSRSLIGLFTLFPLLAVMRVLSPRKSMVCGAFWGASLFVALVAQTESVMPATALSFSLLVSAPATYAFVLVWLSRRYGFNPLMLAFGWGFVELAMTPLGLQGGLLGSAVGFQSGSVLHLLQGVLGYVCIAAIIVALNGLALALLGCAYRKVCGAARVVRSSSHVQQRFFPLEVPIHLRSIANLGRPRAPPV